MSALQVPDVSGSSPVDAALAYANAGFFVLPVARGKHPGSIVGKGWQDKSTTDAEQIERWWEEKPDAGIAIHTGASGLTIFDLDTDAIPEELDWLRTGIVQFSRAESVGSERGHYGFFTGDEIFTSGKLKTRDGVTVGDIKSGNSVVIASPSEHVKVTIGGQYRWRTTDINTAIPKLPSEASKYLRLRGIKKPADGHTTAMAGWCVEATDDAVSEAVKDWQSESRPKPLLNLVNWVKSADAGTRDQTRDALRIASCEARVGFYPLADAITALHDAMEASYTQRGEPDKFDEGEFMRLVKNGVGYAMNRELDEIADEANREYTEDARSSEPIFRTLSATDLATLDAPTEFLIKRVLKTDTFGVNGGPKKSLKTHDNLAIGLAVATGTNLYNDARFEVPQPRKVLYIVGEGGENQIARIFQRMLKAYGIKPEDVDSTFPFVAAFGAAPLDSPKLKDEIKRLLDDHQPELTMMESFYNFHPAGVTASNLYERGQLIDEYHKLIRADGSGVTSLLTDHTKKSATGLDLDEISMSGQAENADSWIMRGHRMKPSVQTGDFWLTTSFNGRDWGGTTYDVDWHLGPFNHDKNAHDGTISWDVHDHGAMSGTASAPPISTLRTDVLALVNANPWRENRSSLVTKLKKNRQVVINEITTMLVDKIIEEDSPKNRGASGKAPVFGPGPAMTAAMGKFVVPKLT